MQHKFEATFITKILTYSEKESDANELKEILKLENYNIKTTLDMNEIINIIQKERIDILILDYLFEKEAEYHKIIKEIRKTSNIYIILLTENMPVPIVETLKNLKAQDYCEKSNIEDIIFHVQTGIKAIKYVKEYIFNAKFKDMLVMLREKNNMSQDDVAIALGLRRGTVVDYENGNSYPSYTSAIKIAELFHVSLDVLMGRFVYN